METCMSFDLTSRLIEAWSAEGLNRPEEGRWIEGERHLHNEHALRCESLRERSRFGLARLFDQTVTPPRKSVLKALVEAEERAPFIGGAIGKATGHFICARLTDGDSILSAGDQEEQAFQRRRRR